MGSSFANVQLFLPNVTTDARMATVRDRLISHARGWSEVVELQRIHLVVGASADVCASELATVEVRPWQMRKAQAAYDNARIRTSLIGTGLEPWRETIRVFFDPTAHERGAQIVDYHVTVDAAGPAD